LKDLLDFSGKTALVVGGSSGIGNAIAQAYKARGAEVHVWGTRPVEEYAGVEGSDLSGLHYTRMDVTDVAAIEAWRPPFPSLDILVCSQGTARFNREEFQPEAARAVIDVNLVSLFTCTNKFYPLLKQTQGTVIIIGSTAAYHSTRGTPAYNASKTGVLGLVRTLGEAWGRDGIRVNGLAPGFVPTKLTKITSERPDRLKRHLDRIPIGRVGDVEDMANVALFLASPMSSYIVGQTIPVDGGLILN
jgi:3-oxoacyl-[acyl-carrier protein] reductase